MPTISQLRYILAVYEHGHFGRAARACHVSQPTLSAQIRKVEETLGLTIFLRQTKPVAPTEKGRLLIERARAVLSAHARLVSDAEGQFEGLAGELTLGVIPTLAPYVIPWFLQTFSGRYPKVKLTITEQTTDTIVADLTRHRLDVGLLAIPLDAPGIQERPLFHDPFYLYAAPSEPILELDEVDPAQLEADKMWLLGNGHCVRAQSLALCDEVEGCAHMRNVDFEVGTIETLRHLVDSSRGYTLVPETFARLLPRARRLAQIRPFSEPTPTRQIGLVHLEDTWKSRLVEALESTVRRTIPQPFREPPSALTVLPVRPQRVDG